jgi:hypothetical protein
VHIYNIYPANIGQYHHMGIYICIYIIQKELYNIYIYSYYLPINIPKHLGIDSYSYQYSSNISIHFTIILMFWEFYNCTLILNSHIIILLSYTNDLVNL